MLQPYQLVKDLRTGVESTNPAAVLDGDLDPFIEAALAERIHGKNGRRKTRDPSRALPQASA